MNISSVDCITELLAYTYHLVDRLATDPVEFDQVMANYDALIHRAKRKAQNAGISRKLFDDALFAVYAWIDETLLGTGWIHRDQWVRQPLQKRFFNTTNAGAQFFERIQKLTTNDQDTLEVFDYCLASGFKGSLYAPQDQEALASIIRDTRKKLEKVPDEDLPEVLFPEAGDMLPGKWLKRKSWRGMSSLLSGFVLLPVVLFAGLYFLFSCRLAHILETLGPVLQ